MASYINQHTILTCTQVERILNVGKASGLTGIVVHRDVDILNGSIASKELPHIVRSAARENSFKSVWTIAQR